MIIAVSIGVLSRYRHLRVVALNFVPHCFYVVARILFRQSNEAGINSERIGFKVAIEIAIKLPEIRQADNSRCPREIGFANDLSECSAESCPLVLVFPISEWTLGSQWANSFEWK